MKKRTRQWQIFGGTSTKISILTFQTHWNAAKKAGLRNSNADPHLPKSLNSQSRRSARAHFTTKRAGSTMSAKTATAAILPWKKLPIPRLSKTEPTVKSEPLLRISCGK